MPINNFINGIPSKSLMDKRAYSLAEVGGFSQSPQDYWLQAEGFYKRQKNSADNLYFRQAARTINTTNRNFRFQGLESQRKSGLLKNRYISRIQKGIDALGGLNSLSMAEGVKDVLTSVSMPLAILGTSMAVGQKFVDYSYNRTELQQTIGAGLDLLVSETPSVLSFATFSAAQSVLTKRFDDASGGKVLRTLGGKPGGIRGKALAFAGSILAATAAEKLFKPVQDVVGGGIASERSSGLLSAIAGGRQSQINAELAKFGGSLKVGSIPTELGQFTTKQFKQAQAELKADIKDEGFWSALANARVIKWSEEFNKQEDLKKISEELTRQRQNLLWTLDDNNKAIIDFYTRE